MGFFSNLFGFGKSKIDEDYMSTAHLIPTYYSSFPIYQQKIIDTPQEKRTDKYDRLELYYYGKPLQEYYDLLKEQGFVQETEVRFNKSPNVYVIVERYGKKTKIAYHIAR